jgi:histidinol dehydrogenase
MKLDDTSPNVEKKNHNQPSSSSTSTKKTLVQMGDIMQEIINEVKKGGVQLIEHTTSLLHVIATDVRSIHLSKVNEVMHLSMVFHCVNDELGNSMHRMKDWHETMLEHRNIRKKRAHEF